MAKALSLRKDRTKGTPRTRKLSTGNVRGMRRKWEGTLREAFLGEWTEGAEPCKVKALSTVFNGGCDMKSFQSLLCLTFGYDTTCCSISSILRRCAGR